MATRREETETAGAIRALARIVRAVRTEDISPRALHQTQLLLLDTIGCGLSGYRESVAEAVARIAIASSGRPQCALIGRRTGTDLANAVLANGVAVRVLDLNDYFIRDVRGQPETGGHPSDNIPVALAAGAARGRSGREILAAIALGYEIYARAQGLMDRGTAWDSVTASGLVAPAIAGWLMGLDETRLAHAIALGAARAATPAIVRSGHISAAKSMANALVAQAGVQAALLAEQGLTGPLAILEDARGLRDLFSQGDAAAAFSAPIPAEGAIIDAQVKTFPCVNTAQTAVTAALKLHEMIGGRTGDITRIEVVMADYPVVKRHQEDPGRISPKSREAADHSFPFLVAVALTDGAFGAGQFHNERWRDPEVMALMAKIALNRDSRWNVRVPGAYPCAIKLSNTDGAEHFVEVHYPPGFSTIGLDEKTVIGKFHILAASILSRADADEIVDAVMEFHHTPSTAKLDTAITKEGNNT